MLPLSTKPLAMTPQAHSSSQVEGGHPDHQSHGFMAVFLGVASSSQKPGVTAIFEKMMGPLQKTKEATATDTALFSPPTLPTYQPPMEPLAPQAVGQSLTKSPGETDEFQPTSEQSPPLPPQLPRKTTKSIGNHSRSAPSPIVTAQPVSLNTTPSPPGPPAVIQSPVPARLSTSETTGNGPAAGAQIDHPATAQTAVTALPQSERAKENSSLTSRPSVVVSQTEIPGVSSPPSTARATFPSVVSGSTPSVTGNAPGEPHTPENISTSAVARHEAPAPLQLSATGQSANHAAKISSQTSSDVPQLKPSLDNQPAGAPSTTARQPAQSNEISSTPEIPPDLSPKILPDSGRATQPNGVGPKTEVKISLPSAEPSPDANNPAKETYITGVTNRMTTTNKSTEPVGIDVAIKESSMPSPSVQIHSESSETKTETMQSVFSATGGLKDGASPLPQEPVSAARQVLGTILRIVDQPERAEQTKVDLHFSFGKDTLAVRVGMHAGEVHTTFQSSSAELRNTLANQWQGFTEHLPENTRALLDPIFKDSTFSHSGSPNHQESSGQQSASRHRETPFQRHPNHPQGESNEEEFTASHRPSASSTGRQLLNTLA